MEQIMLSGWGYQAVICPSRGANLISLCKMEWQAGSLRTPEGEEEFRSTPFFWGTPLLFPPNRISGGCFSFEGRSYSFPVPQEGRREFLHGELHRLPFQIMEKEETFARLRYEAGEENPYLTFPHSFCAEMTYSLTGKGLFQTLSVTNLSRENMPIGIGYHTTFGLPLVRGGEEGEVSLYLDAEEEILRDANYLPTGEIRRDTPLLEELNRGTLVPSLQPLSVHLKMGKSRQMRLTDRKNGIQVVYQPGEAFGFWTLFNGGHRDFVCVEPQSWMTNSPNAPFPREESGFSFLRPGEKRDYTTFFAIEKATDL